MSGLKGLLTDTTRDASSPGGVAPPASGLAETISPIDTKPQSEATIDSPPLSPQSRSPATVPELEATIDPQPRRAPPAPAGCPQVEGYEILKELGRGAMGVVYKARQTKLNRIVALKMVLAGAHASAQQLARFYTEAEAVAHLHDRHIVQIYEVGENDGLPYFSLEYVDGGSLAERIGGKPQPVSESAQQVELLARAMAYAHQQGIIHRDLKPANVLLTAEGLPKITDFGLAKRLESDSSQTKSGTLMGTPSYMAPEQARGEVREVGPLADVYALGVILYELLTGRTPFLGASILDTLQQVRNHEPVPPSRLQPKVPHDLEVVCLKCLEKEPAKRYASADALADDVHRFLAGEPILARSVSGVERLWRWCKRNQRVAALSAAVLSLLVSLAVGSSIFAVIVARQAELVRQQKDVAERNEHLAKEARDEARQSEQQAIAARHEAQQNEQQAITARAEADANAKSAAEQRGLALEALGGLVTRVQNQLRETPATQKLKQDLLLTGLDGLRKVAKSAQSSRFADGMMAEANQRMGDIFQSLGQHAEARQQYEESHAIRLALVRTNPSEVTAQRGLALSYNKLGDVSLLEGDRQLAGQHYGEALQLRESLAVSNSDSVEAQVDLATSYTTLGNVSEPAEAESYYQRALTIRQALAASTTDASRANRERDVWILYNKLAELSLKRKDLAEAAKHYELALAQAKKLPVLAPQSVRAKADLAVAQVNIGNIRLQADELTAAKESFGLALELLRPLAQEDPRNLGVQTNFVLALARYGEHQEAAQKAEALRKLAPQNYLNLYNVACSYGLCASAVTRGKAADQLTDEEQAWQRTYGDRAIAALREAAASGLKDARGVISDPDLDSIRDHAEYARLLDELK